MLNVGPSRLTLNVKPSRLRLNVGPSRLVLNVGPFTALDLCLMWDPLLL